MVAQADGVVQARPGGSRLTADLSLGWHGGLVLSLGLGLPLAIWALLLVMTVLGASAWAAARVVLVAFPILVAAGTLIAWAVSMATGRTVKAALREAAGLTEPASGRRRSVQRALPASPRVPCHPVRHEGVHPN